MTQPNRTLMKWISCLSVFALSAVLLPSSGTALAELPSKTGAAKQVFRPLQVREAIVANGEQVALRVRLDNAALESLKAEATGFGQTVIVPFPISETESIELELERFSLTGPQTRIVVADQSGQREIEIPEIVALRGRVAGQPNSLAYLALRSGGSGGNGFVTLENGETRYLSSGAAGNGLLAPGEFIITQNADPRFNALPEGVEFCGFDGSGQAPGAPSTSLAPAVTLDNRGVRLAQIAVEGDMEFVGLFGGDEVAAATYIVELFGGVSVAYERDVDVRFNVSFIRLWPVGGQPFLTDDVGDFRAHWLANEDTTGLNYVQLLSGRRDLPFGGIGFISTGCADAAYAISGYLNGAFVSPTENFSLNNWDQTVLAHEMGHNSGTLHTHDGYTPTIDDCGNGIPSRGTIMSYCHIHTGYMTNIDYRFHRRVQEVVQDALAGANCAVFDCNGNGIDDALDISSFFSADVNGNGIPDECEDCNGNGILDDIDIAGPTSADMNGNGIPDECEADCNGNSVPDEFEISLDPGLDLNGNNIPDECEADCDGNAIPDFIDIINDPQTDLDRDNILDICQDCNGNFISDWIDLERQNNLFVCDQSGLVREYHQRSGWPIVQYSSGGSFTPFDVTVGPDRALYIANNSAGEILRIPLLTVGAVTPFVASGGALSQPSALLFGSDNNLYVAEQSDGSVQKFDGTTGAHLGAFVSPGSGGLVQPFGMTFGPNGNLFVSSSNNTIIEYNSASGALVGTFVSAGDGSLDSPRGLAFVPATGNLVVASNANSLLLEYDGTSGAFIKIFSDGLSITSPWGIKIGPNGNLFAARGGGVPRIIEYVPEGRYHRYYIRNEADMVSPAGMAFMPQSQFDSDANGILDACVGGLPGCCDTPGDADNGGTVNIGDVTFLIARIFAGGSAPPCQDEGDENGDGTVNISDITYLIARIFASGPAPVCGQTGA